MMQLFCLFGTIQTVFVDGGYPGTLIDWDKQMFRYTVNVVKRPDRNLFKVLPKRWIVERTFAWPNWSRRSSKNYELRPQLSRNHDLHRLRTPAATTRH